MISNCFKDYQQCIPFFKIFFKVYSTLSKTHKNAKIGKNRSGNKHLIESLKWLFLPALKTQNGDIFGFYGQIKRIRRGSDSISARIRP